MKRFNLGKGSPKGPGEGSSPPVDRQGPRKSILIVGIIVILMATAYWVATKFVFVPPPPSPVVRPIPPPSPPVAVPPPPAPMPSQEEKPQAPLPKAEEKRAAPPPPSPETVTPSTAGPRYTLQVGAMIQRGHAMDLQKRLERLGYPGRIRKAVSPKTRYMVYIGEVSSIHEAEAAVQKLQREGFPAKVVSTQGGFLAGVGDFFALDEAIDLAHELQKKQHTPKIVDHRVLTTFHRVLVGSFDNRADALKLGKELKARGFDNFVVKE